MCWEDNWPESPIHVVSLRKLFETTAALQHRIIYQPRPDSLRGQLLALRTAQPGAHAAVSHFLDVTLQELQRRIPAVILDERLTKHFSVRYGTGKGLLGIYPSGRLVCAGVDDTVRTYGPDAAEPTRALRHVVATVGVVRTKDDWGPVLTAIEVLMHTIEQLQRPNLP